jgi:hypothetical protein
MPELPLLDFSSGYVLRARDRLAKQGTRAPWRLRQNYLADLLALRWGRIADGTLRFDEAMAGVADGSAEPGIAGRSAP